MMRVKYKALAILVALFMMIGACASAIISMPAAHAAGEKTNTVTIHKLMMTDSELTAWNSNGPTGYDGSQDFNAFQNLVTGQTLKQVPGVYFAAQKDGAWIKADGTVTTDVKEALGGLTTADGLSLDVSQLPQTSPTKYTFVEVKELSEYRGADGQTLSRQKATPVEITLPFIKADGSVLEDVHVYPKNTEAGKPDHTKDLDRDKTDIDEHGMSVYKGQNVPYVLNTTVPAGSTLNKADWNDIMSAGLSMNHDVTISAVTADGADLGLTAADYAITYGDNGFVLSLNASGLTKLAQVTAPTDANFKVLGADPAIQGQNKEVRFTLRYSANVTEQAIINDALNNQSTFHYGNNPGYTTEPGDNNPPTTKPKNKQIEVEKSFTNGPLSSSAKTTWPTGLSIHFTLQVYDPASAGANGADAGNGWTDVAGKELTLDATHTTGSFTGLDNDKNYRVVETVVDGWVPNYQLEDGKVVIVNKKNVNPKPVGPKDFTVRTFGKKFVKTSEDENTRLADARFVVKNAEGKFLALVDDATNQANRAAYEAARTAYQEEIAKYNNDNSSTTQANIDTKYQAAKAAYEAMNEQYRWVDSENDAFQFASDQHGRFEVVGLAAGTYTLHETKVPDGYASISDLTFVTNASSYAAGDIKYNLEDLTQTASRIINKKVTIPLTGGTGTIIFTILGVGLMAGAAYVAKKNNSSRSE
ncbi:pilin N-terminal domain-containing protein [Alloscardovia theropitheci]|nr:pilin N-terminal domain-containing protein [Alloscardovia theropitheci]